MRRFFFAALLFLAQPTYTVAEEQQQVPPACITIGADHAWAKVKHMEVMVLRGTEAQRLLAAFNSSGVPTNWKSDRIVAQVGNHFTMLWSVVGNSACTMGAYKRSAWTTVIQSIVGVGT
jgi:hypothetical protein